MNKSINLIGMKFGRWTVIQKSDCHKDNHLWWLCKCDCGTIRNVKGTSLKNGKSNSCGCLNKDFCKNLNKSHQMSKTRIYNIWTNIKTRCYNHNRQNYKWYGGRGIVMCSEWLNDFKSFYDWGMSNGYNEDLTIDRIDNNKGYSPDNCRWITMKEQCRNRKSNHLITYNGETHCLTEWAEILNKDFRVLQYKINKLNLTIEDAFFN